jgi:hypothetical protein
MPDEDIARWKLLIEDATDEPAEAQALTRDATRYHL